MAPLKIFRSSRSSDNGQWGEDHAARWLKQNAGFRILAKRARPGRRDEIDIVARDHDTLVFVEVKTRASERFGRPGASVDRRKRQVLSRAAIHYLRRLGWPRINFRFDIVEVIGRPDNSQPPIIRHLENAFPLDRRYQLP